MSCEILPTASSSRRAAPVSTSTTPGGAACSAPSSADSSPVVGDGNVTTINEKYHIILPTYHLLRWPMLRRHVLMDAAAAALDARRLQTFANTGDCATRINKNPGVDQHLGTRTLLILSSDPLNKRTDHAQITHISRDIRREMQGTHDTHQPPDHVVARCCATLRRRPNAASAASASLSPPAHQAPPRSSCCRSLASPCTPWRNAPLRIAPCCCENA